LDFVFPPTAKRSKLARIFFTGFELRTGGIDQKKGKLTNAVKSESILLPQFAQDLVPDSAATSGCGFAAPRSLGLSASQQYFFYQNKPTTNNQSAVLFSQNKSAPAISR
jgi:hypothetical protein